MKTSKSKTKEFKLINPNAAGIDIASQMHYVAVPEDRDEQPVRKFDSFTSDLHQIARWLKECKIETVAMESTGIYWVQLYLILEEYEFEVYLVNAQQIKNVSGRKSDIQDCQWIQQLHTYGLLSASFQPDNLTRELRTYTRHRKNLTQSYSMQIQLMQKAFEQMNVKLHNVLTDICGKSGQKIIQAILAGERNPVVLSELTEKGVKATKEEIISSLEGNWREEHLFELRQSYELYLIFKEKIRDCDQQIEGVLKKNVSRSASSNEIKKKHKQPKIYSKNKLNFNAHQYLNDILGVDITKIFGISELTATEIISETGINMSKWTTNKHFVSWLNLAPNNRISGGKLLRNKKTKKKNKAGQAFKMAAAAVQRSDNWIGAFYRRINSKHGPLVAVKATARKIALIFYDMIVQKKEFNPMTMEIYNHYFREHRLKYLNKQAFKLGMSLVQI